MKQHSAAQPSFSIGASSLLVVFLVLCLVSFATLALSTARRDSSYSRQLADRRAAYYAACTEAELVLDEIDRRLAGQGLTAKLDDLGVAPVEDRQNTVGWQQPIDESQALCVELTLTASGAHYYEITRWQVVTTQSWDNSGGLNLLVLDEEGAPS